jgi:hypothetical protein
VEGEEATKKEEGGRKVERIEGIGEMKKSVCRV